jgi:hypothetical protein
MMPAAMSGADRPIQLGRGPATIAAAVANAHTAVMANTVATARLYACAGGTAEMSVSTATSTNP